MDVKALSEMLRDAYPEGSSRYNLVGHLEHDSEFLCNHQEDITRLWDSRPDIMIASFHETEMTATPSKVRYKLLIPSI